MSEEQAAAAAPVAAPAPGEGGTVLTPTPAPDNAPESGSEPPADSSSPPGDGAPNTPDVPEGQGETDGEDTPPTDVAPTEVAPDEYTDFTVGEEAQVNDESMARFKEFAKGSNMSQEAAQTTLDYIAKEMPGFVQEVQQQQLSAYMQMTKDWKTAYEKDPTIGGTHMRETETAAKRALNYLNDPDLVSILDAHNPETNPNGMALGNHRAIINLLAKYGATLEEDKHEGGDANLGGGSQDSVSERWYG